MVLALIRSRIGRKPWLWSVVSLGFVLGMLPDVIGAYGNIIENDNWKLYRRAHHGDIEQVLRYVPMYSLHLYLDSEMHGEGRRWWRYDERLWLEIVLWVVNVMVIVWLVKSWKANG